jgi:hypothetical protein
MQSKKYSRKEYRRQHYLKNKKHTLAVNKLWAKNNIERKRALWRAYYYRNSKELNKKKIVYRNKVYATNPYFRLYASIRTRINRTIKHNIKCKKTIDLLGIDIKGLWKHLRSKFKPGMTKQNHGKVWHIDHIIPCAAFDLSDPKQQIKCFHYTNLQPLFAHENLSKGAKILKSIN